MRPQFLIRIVETKIRQAAHESGFGFPKVLTHIEKRVDLILEVQQGDVAIGG